MSERPIVAIDFFADLSCPWCYVGWTALKNAAAELRERVAPSLVWRTFLLQPDAPMDGVARDDLLARIFAGDETRRKAAEEALMQAAEEAGAVLNLNAASIIPNTLKAHRLVHLASGYGLGEAAIDALFAAYFVDGSNIGDPVQLLAIAESLGLDPQETSVALSMDDYTDLLAMHQAAVKIGVQGVPVAIFNKKKPVLGAASVADYGRAFGEAI